MEEFQHPVSTLYSASTEFEFRYLEADVRVIRSRQGNETSARGMHRPTSTFVVCAQREKEKKRNKEIEKRKKGEIPMTHRRGDTKAEKKKRRKIYIYISVEIPATMTSFRSDIHRLVSMDPLLCRSRLSNDPVRTIPRIERQSNHVDRCVGRCCVRRGSRRWSIGTDHGRWLHVQLEATDRYSRCTCARKLEERGENWFSLSLLSYESARFTRELAVVRNWLGGWLLPYKLQSRR